MKGTVKLRVPAEPSMGAYDIIWVATFWYLVKSIPGLVPFIGYFFGFILASWLLDEYFGVK
jgi:hypothetical protein